MGKKKTLRAPPSTRTSTQPHFRGPIPMVNPGKKAYSCHPLLQVFDALQWGGFEYRAPVHHPLPSLSMPRICSLHSAPPFTLHPSYVHGSAQEGRNHVKKVGSCKVQS
eukprot:TRINITY_DN17403_c0_g1_i2.p3 TRINITY_DN17403_c0_g1~~TRINITY_DN17403_c0_g1_i2.p3  ORF type:complete len:108 (+),score=0.67 TRINITY_DN17403_c0_g1_i2:432-755(+)